jgi:lipopolysaccharide biosynthesis glycosyltransferase
MAIVRQMSYPLVLACDDGYAMQLATSLRSIVEANPDAWPLDFHLLFDGFSKDTQKKVLASLPQRSASIRWVPVDLRPFREFATLPYISKITYARFLIPGMFPDSSSKVLYLDTDLIVCEDLRPLWETSLDGAVLGAVLDRVDSQLKADKSNLADVPSVRDYFNAGVLLIDLGRWREKHVSENALEYLTRHPRSPYSDQDALNVACDGLWKKLDPRWNFHPYEEKEILGMGREDRPWIVHFVGKRKPWLASMMSLNAGFYDDFRSRTCFARTPGDKLRDTLQRNWLRLKNVLRRHGLLRVLWSQKRYAFQR